MTHDEAIERLRAALAEAGWDPDAVETNSAGDPSVCIYDGSGGPAAPNAAAWRAFMVSGVAGTTFPCWACFSQIPQPAACDHDQWAEPWPDLIQPPDRSIL